MNQFKVDESQTSVLKLPADLTGQIPGQINNYFAGGTFTNVFKCEWRRSSGPVKVAVKSLRINLSEEEQRRFRREIDIWAVLAHDNIVPLFGTTEGYGPYTALVFPWFQTGTLHRLIENVDIVLRIEEKLNLLHGIASGLHYLHDIARDTPVIHGDIKSSNVMVDIKEGKYQARLVDFGLATILGGQNRVIEGSTILHGAIRWTAPELLTRGEPTIQSDMYSFGCVMFHVLTLDIPWNDVKDYEVSRNILDGLVITRPASKPDITNARWKEIEWCWSADALARPSALMAVNFLRRELEAPTGNAGATRRRGDWRRNPYPGPSSNALHHPHLSVGQIISPFSTRQQHINAHISLHQRASPGRISSLSRGNNDNAGGSPTQPSFLEWARNPFSTTRNREHDEGIELPERRPIVVDVPPTRGQPRNYSRREVEMKQEKEEKKRAAIKEKNKQKARDAKDAKDAKNSSAGSSRPSQSNVTQHPGEEAQITPAPDPHPIGVPTSSTTSVIAANPAGTRHWTRLWSALCCMSTQNADGDH